MYRHTGLLRLVYRRQRRTPLDGRQPAGVAVGHDLQRALRWQRPQQFQAVLADAGTVADVLFTQFQSPLQGDAGTGARLKPGHRLLHLLQCPAQVDRGWPGLQKGRHGGLEVLVRSVAGKFQGQAESCRDAYQRGAAHLH